MFVFSLFLFFLLCFFFVLLFVFSFVLSFRFYRLFVCLSSSFSLSFRLGSTNVRMVRFRSRRLRPHLPERRPSGCILGICVVLPTSPLCLSTLFLVLGMLCSALVVLLSCMPMRCGVPCALLLHTNLLQILLRCPLLSSLFACPLSILHIPRRCLRHVLLRLYTTRVVRRSHPSSTPLFRILPCPRFRRALVGWRRPIGSVRLGRSVWVRLFSVSFFPFSYFLRIL